MKKYFCILFFITFLILPILLGCFGNDNKSRSSGATTQPTNDPSESKKAPNVATPQPTNDPSEGKKAPNVATTQPTNDPSEGKKAPNVATPQPTNDPSESKKVLKEYLRTLGDKEYPPCFYQILDFYNLNLFKYYSPINGNEFFSTGLYGLPYYSIALAINSTLRKTVVGPLIDSLEKESTTVRKETGIPRIMDLTKRVRWSKKLEDLLSKINFLNKEGLEYKSLIKYMRLLDRISTNRSKKINKKNERNSIIIPLKENIFKPCETILAKLNFNGGVFVSGEIDVEKEKEILDSISNLNETSNNFINKTILPRIKQLEEELGEENNDDSSDENDDFF